MKILQVVPYFYPAWAYGGPAKLVYDTSKYYARYGHEVTVYTSDCYDEKQRMPKAKYITDVPGLTVRYFKNINNNLAYIYNIFITPGILIQSLKDFAKFDVIHLHDFFTAQNIWISILSRLYNKPYILSVHACLEEQRIVQRGIFKRSFLFLFGKMILRNASYVVATSYNEVKAYKSYQIPEKRIVYLKNGINLDECLTKASRQKSREHFRLSQKDVIVTFLGRIHKIKGLDLLTKAIRRIENSRIHFIIAGSNDGYLPKLKSDIRKYNLQKKITLWGTCFGEEKAQLFKASDIFVYPSYAEGCSLGVLEAASASLPLVISEGCYFDRFKEQKAGIVVKTDDKEIAEALEKLALNPVLCKRYGQNARNLVDAEYSIEKTCGRVLDLYQKAAHAKK